MTDKLPDGFEAHGDNAGFGAAFGPVYLDSANCAMGFFVGPQHLNPIGGCHGGAMATFADHQIAAVRHLVGDGNVHLPTVSLTGDYLAPAFAGDWVHAAVMLVKVTRNLVFSQALITTRGNIIARASAIYRNYKASA